MSHHSQAITCYFALRQCFIYYFDLRAWYEHFMCCLSFISLCFLSFFDFLSLLVWHFCLLTYILLTFRHLYFVPEGRRRSLFNLFNHYCRGIRQGHSTCQPGGDSVEGSAGVYEKHLVVAPQVFQMGQCCVKNSVNGILSGSIYTIYKILRGGNPWYVAGWVFQNIS